MWTRLDHAGKLYATVGNDTNSSTFRLSATLMQVIDPEVLQAATLKTMQRYQKFNVRLSGGFFWHFLARNHAPLVIEEETDYPCFPIRSRGPGAHLLRVLYFEKRISVEFFHALTDGTGALEFLKTLLHSYFAELGIEILADGAVLPADSLPRLGEDFDSFVQYREYCLEIAGPKLESAPRARHIEGTPFDPAGHNVVEAVMETASLKEASKRLEVSVTALMAAVALKALAVTLPGPNNLPFIISLPVNLRQVFPSKSLRNFFVVVNIGGHTDPSLPLAEVATAVRAEMAQKLTKASLARFVTETMRFDRNLASRFTPNLIKRSAIRYGFNRYGQGATSMTLSNLGLVKLPPQMTPLVERLDFHLYPGAETPINLASVSYGPYCTITFSRSIVEADFIRAYVDILKTEVSGPIRLTSNRWGV